MFEPHRIAGFDEPRMQMRAPMFFVGIQREIAPPLVFGQTRLQRMRVILVEPGEAIDLADAGGDDSLPEVLPHCPRRRTTWRFNRGLSRGKSCAARMTSFTKRLAGAYAVCAGWFPDRAGRFWMSSPS